MEKKKLLIYLSEDQHIEFKECHKKHFPHMSFYGMIIDLALKSLRSIKK